MEATKSSGEKGQSVIEYPSRFQIFLVKGLVVVSLFSPNNGWKNCPKQKHNSWNLGVSYLSYMQGITRLTFIIPDLN